MAKKIYTIRFRQDFIEAWSSALVTFQDHCDRFGISRQNGYDWLDKVRAGGLDARETKSSAPHKDGALDRVRAMLWRLTH
jgi:helix-turn-helix protein